MDGIAAIIGHPLVAMGVAGFCVLIAIHVSTWVERRQRWQFWDRRIRSVVAVHIRATGREIWQFGPADIRQIAAATGCSLDDALLCLDEMGRHAGTREDATPLRHHEHHGH